MAVWAGGSSPANAAVAAPATRCHVVPDAAAPKAGPTAPAGSVSVVIPRVVCVPAAPPTRVGGLSGAAELGGGASLVSDDHKRLPFTGTDVLAPAAAGVAAVLGGVALVLVARRRRA